MKCAFNNGDLYKANERYLCIGCVFEECYIVSLCTGSGLCGPHSIIKRNNNQSDIFKL